MSVIVRGRAPSAERLYLYSYGDECTDVTGGWTGYKSAVKEQYAVFQTVNTVDITEYDTLHILVQRSTSNAPTSCGICDSRPFGTSVAAWMDVWRMVANSDFGISAVAEWVIDLAGVTLKTGYIAVGQTGSTNYSNSVVTTKNTDHLFAQQVINGVNDYHAKIYAVWLERPSGIVGDYVNREVSAITAGAPDGVNRTIRAGYRAAGGVVRLMFGSAQKLLFADGDGVPLVQKPRMYNTAAPSYTVGETVYLPIGNAGTNLMVTESPVDLSGFDTLQIDVTQYQNSSYGSCGFALAIFSAMPQSGTSMGDKSEVNSDPSFVRQSTNGSTTRPSPQTISIDVSDLTGEYYPGFYVRSGHNGGGLGYAYFNNFKLIQEE